MNNPRRITISGSVIINNQIDKVFEFFGNPINDWQWRKEVRLTKLNKKLEPGVVVAEYSYLSPKIPENLIELVCVSYEPNLVAIFETLNNSRFYEKSQRLVTAVSKQKTKIIYTLEFDTSIVKYALGFSLPYFLISLKANYDMKKYLKNLKVLLDVTNGFSVLIMMLFLQ